MPVLQHHLDSLSLLPLLKAGICRPAKRTDADPNQLGYRLIELFDGTSIHVSHLHYASAEALITLAMLKHLHDLEPALGHFEIVAADSLSASLLQQCGVHDAHARGFREALRSRVQISGCFYAPIAQFHLSSREECFEAAKLAGEWVAGLPPQVQMNRAALPEAVTRVVQEGLLNVLYHAYVEGAEGRGVVIGERGTAYLAITVTPVRTPENLPDGATTRERQWLKKVQQQGLCLEVAVADHGLGIPRTLWRNFEENHPAECKRLSAGSTGTQQGQANRSALQARICEWALHHRSTRRTQFASPAEALNPRGLHRLLNVVMGCTGALTLRSGQARIGFFSLSTEDVGYDVQPDVAELPGTAIVVRIPNAFGLTGFVQTEKASAQFALHVDALIPVVKLPSSRDDLPFAQRLHQYHTGGVDVFCFPFLEVAADDATALNRLHFLLASHTPHRVCALAFLRLSTLDVMQLRTYGPRCNLTEAPPRLCLALSPDGQGSYMILGHLPEEARRLVADLEENGSATCESDTEQEMARELAHVYPMFVTYDRASRLISLKQCHCQLEALNQQFRASMGALFASTPESPCGSVVESDTNEAFRLSSGTLVKRLFSITLLIRNNALLAAGMAHQLLQLVQAIASGATTCVVADTPSSFFLLQELLGVGSSVPIGNGTLPPGQWDKVVLFSDATWEGHTLKESLLRLGSCVTHCLVAVDLSKNGAESLDVVPKPRVLVRWPFDPHPVIESSNIESITELDGLTNLPRADDKHVHDALGTSEERDHFLQVHPEYFRASLHAIGGRVHVVSVDTHNLVRDHGTTLRKWLCETIIEEIQASAFKPEADILLIARHGTSLSREMDSLAGYLEADLRGRGQARRVFTSVCASVPRNPRSLYTRAAPDFYSISRNAKWATSGTLFSKPLGDGFLAVYVDAAAVTGRTMLNVVNDLLGDHERKAAGIVAIPVVQRMSPREERFLSQCALVRRDDGSQSSTSSVISLAIRPMFRLQVQSYDSVFATPVNAEIIRVGLNEIGANRELRRYLRRLRDRVAAVEGEGSHVAHPWWPEATDAPAPSYNTVRLRHLLALVAQNEGGLSKLREVMLHLTCVEDEATLSMLVLEPVLLNLEPFRHDARNIVVGMAERVVRAGAKLAAVSDALVVLHQFPSEFLRLLPALIQRTVGNSNLRALFALLLLDSAARDAHVARQMDEQLGEELARLGRDLPKEQVSYLYRLRSSVASLPHGTLRGAGSAAARICEMLSMFYVHSLWHSRMWQPFCSVMRERDMDGVRRLSPNVVDALRQSVLPAFVGLRDWLYEKGDSVLADKAATEYGAACVALDDFVRVSNAAGADAAAVEKAWHEVLDHLVECDAQYFLTQEMLEPHPVPSLQRILTSCFCSPAPLVKKIFEAQFPAARASTEQGGEVDDAFHPVGRLLVCPGTLAKVCSVMSLVIDNIRVHGLPATVALAGKVEKGLDGTRKLVLRVTNAPAPNRQVRNNQGLLTAKSVSDSAGWGFEWNEDTTARLWTVTITCPVVCSVTPRLKEDTP